MPSPSVTQSVRHQPCIAHPEEALRRRHGPLILWHDYWVEPMLTPAAVAVRINRRIRGKAVIFERPATVVQMDPVVHKDDGSVVFAPAVMEPERPYALPVLGPPHDSGEV